MFHILPAFFCSFVSVHKIDSTNIGDVVTVRFNLATRSAYSGDWGWVLGRVDPSLTVVDANNPTAANADQTYDERCPNAVYRPKFVCGLHAKSTRFSAPYAGQTMFCSVTPLLEHIG